MNNSSTMKLYKALHLLNLSAFCFIGWWNWVFREAHNWPRSYSKKMVEANSVSLFKFRLNAISTLHAYQSFSCPCLKKPPQAQSPIRTVTQFSSIEDTHRPSPEASPLSSLSFSPLLYWVSCFIQTKVLEEQKKFKSLVQGPYAS